MWRKIVINILKNMDLQSQSIYDEILLFKKNLHILEESGVQVGDIEWVPI